MPVRPTYPGVYIEEIPSGIRTITGVSTAVAAFVGTFPRGLLDEAVQLFGLVDFEREYGGLSAGSETSYAVQQFFLNGGTECFVVRVADTVNGPVNQRANAATTLLTNGGGTNVARVRAGRRIRGQTALNPGAWSNSLRLEIDYGSRDPGSLFNLTVSQVRLDGDRTVTVATERFANLSLQAGADNALDAVGERSVLVQLDRDGLPALPADGRPAANGTLGGPLPAGTVAPNAGTALTVVLNVNGAPQPAIPLAVPAIPAPRRLQDWAQALQDQLRAVPGRTTAPLIPLDLQPYFGEATVEVIGDNTVASPARFVVRTGRGARPFDPTATLTLAGTDAATYGFNAATIRPQLYVLADGRDGPPVPVALYRGSRAAKTGLYALEDIDLFNILCLPDAASMPGGDMRALYTEAEIYCEERRSMLLVDVPEEVVTLEQMQAWLADNESLRHPNAAVYYPRTLVADPLARNRLRSRAASGTIAGLYARTDTQRGVWKAPAGTDARLRNVQSLTYVLTDAQNGALNPLGVNCLRTFPIYSTICWGARTLEGADALASDWKYLPGRRLALFLEESLYRGTKWVVFEPNDEPLWSQIRLNVGAFMQDLFRKGAFQGATPGEAYFVRCDAETTTQTDIDNGIVNIEVGFAPLKPAEFVILKIQQIARQAEV